MEILVAVLSAVAGLFLYQAFGKYNSDKGQRELQDKVKKLEDQSSAALQEIKDKERETQGKVDEITKEQDKPISNSDLVDFFNNRKN